MTARPVVPEAAIVFRLSLFVLPDTSIALPAAALSLLLVLRLSLLASPVTRMPERPVLPIDAHSARLLLSPITSKLVAAPLLWQRLSAFLKPTTAKPRPAPYALQFFILFL